MCFTLCSVSCRSLHYVVTVFIRLCDVDIMLYVMLQAVYMYIHSMGQVIGCVI